MKTLIALLFIGVAWRAGRHYSPLSQAPPEPLSRKRQLVREWAALVGEWFEHVDKHADEQEVREYDVLKGRDEALERVVRMRQGIFNGDLW